MNIELRDARPGIEDLLPLYTSVGWTSYTRDPDTLAAAIRGSFWVHCAYDGDQLVGLARCLSDDATIVYLQDILVDPAYHRAGIGRQLMQAVSTRFARCRQLVLLTDDRPDQAAFYRSMGLVRTDEATTATLRTFVKMPGLS